MVKQKKQLRPLGPLAITLIVVGGLCLMAAIPILPKYIYDYNETYRDRPLATGYEYVGRDYTSRCMFEYIWIHEMCFIMESERYYYTTDLEPIQLVSSGQFKDWEITQGEAREERLRNYNDMSIIHEYSAHGTSEGVFYSTGYRSYEDIDTVTRVSSLKKDGETLHYFYEPRAIRNF